MVKITVVSTGDKALDRKLRKLEGKDAKAVIRRASKEVLKPFKSDIKETVSRDTGETARSVRARSIKRSRKHVGSRVSITAPHGSFVELGTKNVTAQRKMITEAKNQRRKLQNKFGRQIGIELERLAKRTK